jgi:hypothetical protein
MKIWIALSFTIGCMQSAQAQSITDKIIVALVDKHLPQTLHQEKNTAWQMGTYDLTVSKTGGAQFTSTHKYLSFTMPIKVTMVGLVNREILGQKIVLNCSSNVITSVRLDIEPLINPPKSKAKVEVSVPIPESTLNCDGLQIPIKSLLEQIIVNKKQEWEQKLERDIWGLFEQVGI